MLLTSSMSSVIIFDFNQKADLKNWYIVDDDVMGGKSSSTIQLNAEGHGVFEGEISLENNKFTMFDFALSWKSATLWVILLGRMANNLISYSSDQTVIQRYMTTKDEKYINVVTQL